MDINKTLFKEDGSYQPINLEFSESAGPVSPQYQFVWKVILTLKDGKPYLDYTEQSDFSEEKPKNDTVFQKNLEKDVYTQIMRDLLQSSDFSGSRNFIGDKISRVGISFNRFSLKIADISFQLDYTLSDKKSPEFKRFLPILEQISKWKNFK